MQKVCFTISLFHGSTWFEHQVLIVRRSKLYYTASGIIIPIGGRPVHGTATNRYLYLYIIYILIYVPRIVYKLI